MAMSNSGHWSTGERGRSRRRFLGTVLAGSTGAALLAACGGEKEGSTGGEKQGLVATPTAQPATTKQPKPGGSLSFQMTSPPPSLDPYTQTSFLTSMVNGLTYSKLVRFRAGVPEVTPNDFSMEPDLTQAIPEQPEPVQLVFKLKPAKFHNAPPVNGRAVTSDDVRYALDRYRNFDRSAHRPTWAFVDAIDTNPG